MNTKVMEVVMGDRAVLGGGSDRGLMKAAVFSRYGSADGLEVKDVERPEPGPGEVLVRVRASSINDWDAGLLAGKPYFTRLFTGLLRPRIHTLGCDVAGTVERVGANVVRFKPGDAVYGDIHAAGFGAFAEYVCVDQNVLEKKPASLTFEEAAAVPHGATLAWQGLASMGAVQPGRSLLINGAGGGVGPIAMQLGKLRGLEVTGVDRAEKLPMLRELGFDYVFDYERHDFTAGANRYDLILDVKTSRSPFKYARALTPNGVYVTVGGASLRLLQVFLCGPLIRMLSGKTIKVLVLKANGGLVEIGPLFERGELRPVVDGPYALEDVGTAMGIFARAEQKGRMVIAIK
jgi:NADPH:quinone reductase-like Zn-dependent oxidoreductase